MAEHLGRPLGLLKPQQFWTELGSECFWVWYCSNLMRGEDIQAGLETVDADDILYDAVGDEDLSTTASADILGVGREDGKGEEEVLSSVEQCQHTEIGLAAGWESEDSSVGAAFLAGKTGENEEKVGEARDLVTENPEIVEAVTASPPPTTAITVANQHLSTTTSVDILNKGEDNGEREGEIFCSVEQGLHTELALGEGWESEDSGVRATSLSGKTGEHDETAGETLDLVYEAFEIVKAAAASRPPLITIASAAVPPAMSAGRKLSGTSTTTNTTRRVPSLTGVSMRTLRLASAFNQSVRARPATTTIPALARVSGRGALLAPLELNNSSVQASTQPIVNRSVVAKPPSSNIPGLALLSPAILPQFEVYDTCLVAPIPTKAIYLGSNNLITAKSATVHSPTTTSASMATRRLASATSRSACARPATTARPALPGVSGRGALICPLEINSACPVRRYTDRPTVRSKTVCRSGEKMEIERPVGKLQF